MTSYTPRELDDIIARHAAALRHARNVDCIAYATVGFAVACVLAVLLNWWGLV